MRLFFGALVLNFIFFFNKIEASDTFWTNLQPVRMRTNKDRNRVDSLGTSRLSTIPPPRRIPNSMENEALDLHRYPPHIQESFQQTRSQEVLDLANKFKMRHEHYSQGASSTRMIQSDQIQHQEQEMSPPVPGDQRRGRRKREPKTQEEQDLENKLTEARNVHKQTLREQSARIQRRLYQDNQQVDHIIEYKEEDGFKHYQSHYPDGLPYPLPQPQFVPRYNFAASGSGSRY